MHVAAGVGTPTLAMVGNDAETVGAPSTQQREAPTHALSHHQLCFAAKQAPTMAALPKLCHVQGVDAQQVIRWLE